MLNKESIYDEVVLRIEYGNNCGSGVLIPTHNRKWLCVLTAHHVLGYEIEIAFDRLIVQRYKDHHFEKIELFWTDYFFDSDIDLAVLIAEYQDAHELPVSMLREDDLIYMCGFPENLQTSRHIKRYGLEGKVKSTNREELIASIKDTLGTFESPEIDSLKGYSGAGIFSSCGNKLVLAGIETEALSYDAAFHSVRNVSIYQIEKLIYAHKQDCFEKPTEIFEHRDVTTQIIKSEAYFQILRPIIEFHSQHQSTDVLKAQYLAGINAHPDHIRNGFDIRRTYWIKQIEEEFNQNNVVIIRGASGQGKSTLAYRFCFDYYPEDKIVCVKRILNWGDIEKAVTSLKQVQLDDEFVLIYDVQPGDMEWADFIEEFVKYGKELHCKLLVTIRQEDYNRTHFDKSRFMVSEIELQLTEKEAMYLYERYKSSNYLSFMDSWTKFGEGGPLMEYIFMLNHSESLVERIRGQISRIEDTDDADEWISILEVIALTGKHNHMINLERLFTVLPCRNTRKLLQQFKKELFIKISSDGNYIECLHAVRAEIMFRVLREEMGFDCEKVLLRSLTLIEESPLYMLIEYYRESSCTEKLVKKIVDIDTANIKVIQGILQSLLWYEVFEYQLTNHSIIEEGDKLLNNQFISLGGTGDITGYLNLNGDDNQNPSDLVFQLLDKQRPGIKSQIQELQQSLPLKQLKYKYVDLYLSLMKPKIKKHMDNSWSDISAIGYFLFWASCRGQSITLNSLPEIDFIKSFGGMDCLDLMKGLNLQRNNTIRHIYREKVFSSVLDMCDIAFYWWTGNEIFAQIIIDPCTEELIDFNEYCMKAIWALRILEPEMARYNVQILGVGIDGLYVPDTKKSIPSENLHEKWLTEINSININMHDYNTVPDNWSQVCNRIIERRASIVFELSMYLKIIDNWYKKNRLDTNALKLLLQKIESGNPFIIPKCARDKYGIIKEKSTTTDAKNDPIFDREYSIENLSQRYFEGINNFFSAVPGLLSEIMNNEIGSNEGRRALLNITNAYGALLQYQSIFKKYFNDYSYDINLSEELLVVMKAASITRQMCQYKYRIEKNIVYSSTEMVKKEFRKIDAFLNNGIVEIQGIQHVSYQGDTIALTVSIENINAFLYQLFSRIRALLGERGEILISKEYFLNKLRYFKVQYNLDNITIMKAEIPVINFLISDDFKKFQLLCGYGNRIIKNEKGSIQTKILVLLVEAWNGINTINDQVFKINSAISHQEIKNSNGTTLTRINQSYQRLVDGFITDLMELLNLLKDNYYVEQEINATISEIVIQMRSYKCFISRSTAEAQELYEGLGKCLQQLTTLLGLQ